MPNTKALLSCQVPPRIFYLNALVVGIPNVVMPQTHLAIWKSLQKVHPHPFRIMFYTHEMKYTGRQGSELH